MMAHLIQQQILAEFKTEQQTLKSEGIISPIISTGERTMSLSLNKSTPPPKEPIFIIQAMADDLRTWDLREQTVQTSMPQAEALPTSNLARKVEQERIVGGQIPSPTTTR